MTLILAEHGAVYTADADLTNHTVTVRVRYGQMDIRVTLSYTQGDVWGPTYNIERFYGEQWVYYMRKLPRLVDETVYHIGYLYAVLMGFQ